MSATRLVDFLTFLCLWGWGSPFPGFHLWLMLPGASPRWDPIQATEYSFQSLSHPSHWKVSIWTLGDFSSKPLGLEFPYRDTITTSQQCSRMNPEQRSWKAYSTCPRTYMKLSLSQPSKHLSPCFLKILMPANSLCLTIQHPCRKRKLLGPSGLFTFFILLIFCVSFPRPAHYYQTVSQYFTFSRNLISWWWKMPSF